MTIDEEIGLLLRAKLRAEDRARGLLTAGMTRKQHASMQCRGKEAFAQSAVAQSVAGELTKKYRMPFNVYQCEHCRLYHVGSRARKAL